MSSVCNEEKTITMNKCYGPYLIDPISLNKLINCAKSKYTYYECRVRDLTK